MRFLPVYMAFFVALTFSGVPELISGLLEDQTYVSIQDDTDAEEKEDTSEIEEKEERGEAEDVMESLFSDNTFLVGLQSGPSLETRNGILRDSGFYPEDHCPPPERV